MWKENGKGAETNSVRPKRGVKIIWKLGMQRQEKDGITG